MGATKMLQSPQIGPVRYIGRGKRVFFIVARQNNYFLPLIVPINNLSEGLPKGVTISFVRAFCKMCGSSKPLPPIMPMMVVF